LCLRHQLNLLGADFPPSHGSRQRVKARQPHNPCSTRSREDFRSFAGDGGRPVCIAYVGHESPLMSAPKHEEAAWANDGLPRPSLQDGAGGVLGAAGAAMARKAASTFAPNAFLATVGPGHTVSDLRKGEVVFRQSAAADAVFYIQKGKIKIVVASEEGKEAVVGIMSLGEFFGEGCLIGQPLRLATAKAMTESQVVRVSKPEQDAVALLDVERHYCALLEGAWTDGDDLAFHHPAHAVVQPLLGEINSYCTSESIAPALPT
jgi:Cyclic nucleotide-binding domain